MASKQEIDPNRLWLNKGATFNVAGGWGLPLYNRRSHGWFLNILPNGQYEVEYKDPDNNEWLAAIATPSVLLQTDVVTLGEKTEEGDVVKSVRQTWPEIVKQIQLRKEFLFEFTKSARAFEMFLAATYRKDGFDEVILTPRSNDRGRDVIASKTGARILDQAKAYNRKLLVTHEEVRAMAFVVLRDRLPSTGAITTTSDFAPTIETGDEFYGIVPDMVELRNGNRLRDWLTSIVKPPAQSKCRK